MIKLLRMVRSRRWKNSFFLHFQVCLLREKKFCHAVRFLHISLVSVIALYFGRFHSFSLLITETTLQWHRMPVRQYVYISFVLPYHGCQITFNFSL